MEKETMVKAAEEVCLQCFSCGICIGPGYDEYFPYDVGDKKICGWCHGRLGIQGYIQLNYRTRLMPDGTVIKFTQKVNDDGTGEGQGDSRED